jgi:hypothetical protein
MLPAPRIDRAESSLCAKRTSTSMTRDRRKSPLKRSGHDRLCPSMHGKTKRIEITRTRIECVIDAVAPC